MSLTRSTTRFRAALRCAWSLRHQSSISQGTHSCPSSTRARQSSSIPVSWSRSLAPQNRTSRSCSKSVFHLPRPCGILPAVDHLLQREIICRSASWFVKTMNTRPRTPLSRLRSPAAFTAKKSSSGGISSVSTSASHSIPSTRSTARMNSSTVAAVSSTATSSGTISRASIIRRTRRSSIVRCRRSNFGDSRSIWRSGLGK